MLPVSPAVFEVCWVFPEPILPPGAELDTGVQTHLAGEPKLSMMFPLEPLVQGRKCIRRRWEMLL